MEGAETAEAALRGRTEELGRRLTALAARGVVIHDPRQTYIADDVQLERISPGAILHPGARLSGPRLFLGPGAELGREGPVTVRDAVLGEGARIDGGFAEGAVLLRGASAGADAHLRAGTLMEEESSTAHAVGLKHTILLAFVTLGSLINFCDALVAGGTSRRDHSEVGSGYIHFNYTPWGRHGDKATPSICGDVPRGVLLRGQRVFLGGSGGMVGPRRVGFGAVVGAGQVLRQDLDDERLLVSAPRPVDRVLDPDYLDPVDPRRGRNRRYIAELLALRAWYREVRLPRIPLTETHAHRRIVIDEAIVNIELAIEERLARLRAFCEERGASALSAPGPTPPCPLPITAEEPYIDPIAWVKRLDSYTAGTLEGWLREIVADF
jgi:hypothetical protein